MEQITYEHIMLDLETMGKGPNAPIISIGACVFDPVTESIGPTFYTVVSLEDNMKMGRMPDASTILWWMEQSDEARLEFINPSIEPMPVADALEEFNYFISVNANPEKVYMWANSPAFDCVKLQTAAEQVGIEMLWKFYNERDFRTMKNALPYMELDLGTVKHNALDDAKWQAQFLMRALAEADNVIL